jgi:hypothetical protein
VHRLVCAGYARPGQTSRALLDTFALDLLLDFAYGQIVTTLDAEARADFDRTLEQLDDAQPDDSALVTKRLSSGKAVQITEARLEQIRRNAGALAGMKRK